MPIASWLVIRCFVCSFVQFHIKIQINANTRNQAHPHASFETITTALQHNTHNHTHTHTLTQSSHFYFHFDSQNSKNSDDKIPCNKYQMESIKIKFREKGEKKVWTQVHPLHCNFDYEFSFVNYPWNSIDGFSAMVAGASKFQLLKFRCE